MVIVGFLVGSVVLCALMCLPFFVWTRRRQPRGGPYNAPLTYTRTGWLLLVIQVLAMFSGLFVRELQPQSTLGAWLHDDRSLLKWYAGVVVLSAALDLLARRAGLVLRRSSAPGDASIPAANPAQPAERAQGFRLATIAGVPVFVRRSFFLAGALLALIAGAGLPGIAGYCLAYAVLFALHECGHAAVAHALGLRVYSVELSAVGGFCRLQMTRRPRDTWLVYSAGLAAQILLLLLTLAGVAIFGHAHAPFAVAVVTTFTWVNMMVFLINLLPGRTLSGLQTDGSILWGLYRHVARNEAHPLAAQHAASPLFDPSTRLLTIAGLRPEGFRSGLEMLNDDTTPLEFVVAMLQAHAGLDEAAASAVAMQIHTRGGVLLPLADRAHADAVADAIARDARAQGHHLVCRAVSADD